MLSCSAVVKSAYWIIFDGSCDKTGIIATENVSLKNVGSFPIVLPFDQMQPW